jgi:ribonucleotide reductase beta subunit family protein with ferritin-like domain
MAPVQHASSSPCSLDADEPLLAASEQRYCLFPIRYQALWQYYKKSFANFWVAEEIDLSGDLTDWEALSEKERRFMKTILAFFASADSIVMENLAVRFSNEVQPQEAKLFYGFQAFMEGIHNEVYSLIIDTFVKDPAEKEEMFDAIETIPCVKRKGEWALRWIGSDTSFAERLVAFACVEGIFFSGSFCSIFWLKRRGLMPGLTFSNELIARDEALHTAFAAHLYSNELRHQLSAERVKEIVCEAVEIETEFIADALPVSLSDMNRELMTEYIQYVADRLLQDLGCEKVYDASNPFPWMELISMEGKTNIFEHRAVSLYQMAGVMEKLKTGKNLSTSSFEFSGTDDF